MLSGSKPVVLFSCSDRVESLPTWLRPHWPQFVYYIAQLQHGWSKSVETKLKGLISAYVPKFSRDLLQVNIDAENLHMQFLREALLQPRITEA